VPALESSPLSHGRPVWFAGAMGLLDDAIREHLELKRLRGADPGDVARQENDALGSVSRKNVEKPAAPEDALAASHVNQETVEINMDAELAADAAVEQGPEGLGPAAHARAMSADGTIDPGELLEWETPGDEDSSVVKPVEGMLEETPDFLRDTPEQERLSFEQRPPRDFDFKE
jgi:hypothetical protein